MKSSPSLNLLLLSTAYSIGGMERIVCGLSREFTSRDWNVRTIFPKSDKDDQLLEWCREQGVPAETSSALLDAADFHTWKAVSQLRDFVKKTNPETVNIHYGDNFISIKDMIAMRLSGKRRIIVTVHHPTPWNVENRKKRAMTFLSGLLADQLVTVSRATYRVLRQTWIPASKLVIIPCGLRIPEHKVSREQARYLFGFPQDQVVIGTLSRLVPHKGIADLIMSIDLIKDQQAKLFLAVAGDGPEKNSLEDIAGLSLPGKHKFLGRIEDVDQFMSAIDIFVLPSYLEGFGLVFIEAAFHSVPSVGTDVGGVPDAILANKTGMLVSPGDKQSLANAIERLARNEPFRNELGRAARAHAISNFTESRMADRYEAVFRSHCALNTPQKTTVQNN